MKTSIQTFLKDETGVTAIEYGLIAGLIVAAIAGTVGTIGTNISQIFTNISTAVASAIPKS